METQVSNHTCEPQWVQSSWEFVLFRTWFRARKLEEALAVEWNRHKNVHMLPQTPTTLCRGRGLTWPLKLASLLDAQHHVKRIYKEKQFFFVLLSYLIKEYITVNIITACKYIRMTQAAEAESSSTTGLNNTRWTLGKQSLIKTGLFFFPTTETLDSANVFRTELSIWNISIYIHMCNSKVLLFYLSKIIGLFLKILQSKNSMWDKLCFSFFRDEKWKR